MTKPLFDQNCSLVLTLIRWTQYNDWRTPSNKATFVISHFCYTITASSEGILCSANTMAHCRHCQRHACNCNNSYNSNSDADGVFLLIELICMVVMDFMFNEKRNCETSVCARGGGFLTFFYISEQHENHSNNLTKNVTGQYFPNIF